MIELLKWIIFFAFVIAKKSKAYIILWTSKKRDAVCAVMYRLAAIKKFQAMGLR